MKFLYGTRKKYMQINVVPKGLIISGFLKMISCELAFKTIDVSWHRTVVFNIWQCLKTLLLVTTRGMLLLSSECVEARDTIKRPTVDSRTPKERII